MSVTSGWEWQTIDRREAAVSIEPIYIYRPNWTLVRTRISDAAYSSELGDTTSSLSGLNGGVTETITPPPSVFRITCTHASYSGTALYPSGDINGGYPVYQSDIFTWFCSELQDYINARIWIFYSSTGAGQSTRGYVGSAATGLPYDSSYDCQDSIGLYSGGWGLPPNFSSADTALEFQCVSDSQVYNQKSVDWYTQQQTWVARSRNTTEDTFA